MENVNIKDINDNNIISDINLILFNIPNDITSIEKVRWLYIKLGDLFSYNYKVVTSKDESLRKLSFEENYLSSFETCIQISQIMDIVINGMIDGCKSRTIKCDNNFRGIDESHVANEITFDNGEKYILDLTLDLYLIQSGCQTKHFGYTSPNGNYDIFPLVECETIDKKLGLIKYGEYIDKKINDLKSRLNNIDYSRLTDEEILQYKINELSTITPKFKGPHEGKMYLEKLFIEVLKTRFKEYNLTQIKDNKMNLVTVFRFIDTDTWYIYSSNIGMIKSSKDNIKTLLNSGWNTRSNSLYEDLEERKLV